MERNIARVKSLVAVSIPLAALMKENLHLIDEILSAPWELPVHPERPGSKLEVHRFGRGALSREIQVVAEQLDTVSAPGILSELRARGVVINQNRPESSVGNALRRLARAGVLKEVRSGSGRAPAVYRLAAPRQLTLWRGDL